jgi:hypothetical protein
MASSSTQPESTAQNPTSNGTTNGTNHESAGTSDGNNENGVRWSSELVQDLNDMMAKMNLMKTNLLKIQDDVALLRKSFADVQQTLERLRDLVPKEPVPSSDTST